MKTTMHERFERELKRVLHALKETASELSGARLELDLGGAVHGEEIAKARASLVEAELAAVRSCQALRVELARYAEGLEWERLTVALYGETNAGKSALLEALTCGDGASVGDGRKDHTDRLREVSLGALRLLDTPGIEGKEGTLLLEIERALSVAHVVLVVLSDKEPETGMLSKLQGHARRASHVYSVLNKRGRPTAYRHRKDLIDPDTERQEARIRGKMLQVFGAKYQGHLTVNALLGLLSHGRPLERRFLPDRQKTVEIFGTLAAAQQGSRLELLEQVLREAIPCARAIIVRANLHRATDTLGEVGDRLGFSRAALIRAAGMWRTAMTELQPAIRRQIERTRRIIGLRVEADLAVLSSTLKTVLHEGLAASTEPAVTEARIKLQAKAASVHLKAALNADLEAMGADVRAVLEKAEARLHLHIELDRGLGDLSQMLGQVVRDVTGERIDFLLGALSAAVVWLVNPLLGLLGAVLTGLRRWWDGWGRGRERRLRAARAKANAAVDERVERLRIDQLSSLDKAWLRLTDQIDQQLAAVASVGDSLQRSALRLELWIARVRAARVGLETLFTEEFGAGPAAQRAKMVRL